MEPMPTAPLDSSTALSTLVAVSPIDGRYAAKTAPLRQYFSEYGLIYYRVLVELQWFTYLAATPAVTELPALSPQAMEYLHAILGEFSVADAQTVKDFEQSTNHDVKAVEYFIKQKFTVSGFQELFMNQEFVHFACTSEDINNLAYALMLSHAREQIILPPMQQVITKLRQLAKAYQSVVMLAKTHGQTASPTTMGKEFANVITRLESEIIAIEQCTILGKFNGAVGNFNAHLAAYPNINWLAISNAFVKSLGLTWNPLTTQIEPHDYMAKLFDTCKRFNTILIDFNRDIWAYIAIGYFKQKQIVSETGSSTMPHKVNPIDFENSEGNLGLANAILAHLSSKLPLSRWQRDLTDSTVLRNLGVGLGYSLIAYQSILKGLGKLEINHSVLKQELANSWEVLAEPIQTIMRKYGIAAPYEKLKALTRGESLNQDHIANIIESLELPDHAKTAIKTLTPANYIGLAEQLVDWKEEIEKE